MKNTAKKLNELVKICNDGKDFYRKGAEDVNNPELKNLFTIMANAREKAIDDMEPFIDGRGYEVEENGTVSGTLRQGYASMQKLFRDDEKVLIEQLEEVEDKTLEAFEDAMHDDVPPNINAVIASNFTTFKETHQTMRNLKQSL
ncbi:MAG: PA2169 family four-helix-bundle protein [Pseudomonadota bacterium]|nr:PA2169 family four-helix-bundle protein [Pseudomonadota bacterium]